LSKRALARANKSLDEQEVNLLFVSHHYGKDLADRLRKYLEKTDHEKS
jgi:vacuolar-type H+-ATPase subunit F/Vma7